MDASERVNWQSADAHWLLSPRATEAERATLVRADRPELKAHVWIRTSGSTAIETVKWVGLSKSAILASAAAVNSHLRSSSRDRWLNGLPTYHIGGLAIHARAHLSGAQVHELASPHWSSAEFLKALEVHEITLTSLVPTQLHDLVESRAPAPRNLRAVVVGGGALPPKLYERARELGWPLLASYGLSECASQVATAELDSWVKDSLPILKPLNHVTVATDEDGRLRLKSPALLTAYWEIDPKSDRARFWDPKEDGWFTTEDRGEADAHGLTIRGRDRHVVKVGGELVNVFSLQGRWQECVPELSAHTHVVAVPCPRLGHRIVLVSDRARPWAEVERRVRDFADHVRPFERIREIYRIERIPRTELGKVREGDVETRLGF